MKHKTYMMLSSLIFFAVGVLHGYRAYKHLDLIIGTWHVAVVWSWVSCAVALYLSYQGYKHRR